MCIEETYKHNILYEHEIVSIMYIRLAGEARCRCGQVSVRPGVSEAWCRCGYGAKRIYTMCVRITPEGSGEAVLWSWSFIFYLNRFKY